MTPLNPCLTDEDRGLEPCPFCGSDDISVTDATRILGVWSVLHRCKVIGAIKVEGYDRARAVEQWNTRADRPTSDIVGLGLPANVVALVIAGREVMDTLGADEINALDKALEAFASRVPYENEPDEDPTEGASK